MVNGKWLMQTSLAMRSLLRRFCVRLFVGMSGELCNFVAKVSKS